MTFIATNITGTFNLLDAFARTAAAPGKAVPPRQHRRGLRLARPRPVPSPRTTPYDPSSPYSASKAASDHLVRAYHRTYGLPTKITNCSNNYGPLSVSREADPADDPERARAASRCRCTAKGENVRDWLYVERPLRGDLGGDRAKGKVGETYNIGGRSERKNIDVVHAICKPGRAGTRRARARAARVDQYVEDRPGHDLRYAIDRPRSCARAGCTPQRKVRDRSA